MYRLLNQYRLEGYIILFFTVIIFWIPSFHLENITVDEAQNFIAGQRLASGFSLYQEVWTHSAPLTAELYFIFCKIFHGGTFIALRIFTIFYIFLTAILLNQIFNSAKLFSSFTLLPGFFYIVISSAPWHELELNTQILLTPFILAIFFIIHKSVDSDISLGENFLLGVLLAAMVLISPDGLVFILFILAGFLFYGSFKLKNIVTVIIGFIFIYTGAMMIFFLCGTLKDFISIGWLSYYETLVHNFIRADAKIFLENIKELFILGGGFLILGVLGGILFEKNYFQQSISSRRAHSVIVILLILSIVSLLVSAEPFTAKRFFIASSVPGIYFLTLFFQNINKKWIAITCFYFSFLIPLMLLAFYFIHSFSKTNTNTSLKILPLYGESHNKYFQKNEKYRAVEKIVYAYSKNDQPILILAPHPEWYLFLNRPIATKYSDFQLVEEKKIFFSDKYLPELYEEFSREMPAVIVDPNHNFARIKQKLPLLLNHYKEYQADSIPVFVWEK